jgi:AcrR family transcriptional regulator
MLVKGAGGAVEKRVDPRVKRTRGLIVRAFNELVAEKGHTGLTVQEIAEWATISRATFYAHFADQYKLFDHASSEAFREVLRRRLPDPSVLGAENLKALVLAASTWPARGRTEAFQAAHRGAGAGRTLRASVALDRSVAGRSSG